MPSIIGYALVSSEDESTRQQYQQLRAAGRVDIYEDVISGMSTQRDRLDECLAALQPSDTLVVVALDRLGRSTSHVVLTIEQLGLRGIGFW